MISQIIRCLNNYFNFYLVALLVFLIVFKIAPNTNLMALDNSWDQVAISKDGIQFINRDTITSEKDGIIKVVSKFLPVRKENEIEKEYIYLMKIDCIKGLYKDIEINNYLQEEYNWHDSNGDLLIQKTIEKSCSPKFS